jgi:pilus assembly protein CpaF
LVQNGYNIFISGGTGSGKTTFLNALCGFIPKEERVITIEDSAELKIFGIDNLVRMECRPKNTEGENEITIRDLIKTSLRMRPTRIIVGEVRGPEALDMLQAMNTGHDGSMSTGHGNSIKGMLNRLETMYLSDSQVSVYSVRNQIANAIDIFVHLRRDAKGRRYVEEVAEMTDFDGTDYKLNYLYKADEGGVLAPTGNGLIDRERLIRSGYDSILTGSIVPGKEEK